MKKILSIVLSIALLLTVIPAAVKAKESHETRLINQGSLEIDDDGSDGYTGDYVVVYNPDTGTYNGASTGNMSGLIETDIDESFRSNYDDVESERPYIIDIDDAFFDKNAEKPSYDAEKSISFNVGDTHTFSLNSSYCPLPGSNVEFEVLAKGEHCYIWTPTSNASNVYPLDSIDESFAELCANEFDSKFALMQSSFGDHTNGSQGDGRLNILYYNIDDGWTPGNGYVAGFFSSSDIASNGMPVLNIDTYPGVYYVNTAGEVIIDIADTYGTMVHEYQHLINYSECGYTDTWINECMSAAAEEICYPGSSIAHRIQSWIDYSFSDNEDWLNPPAEHEYNPAWSLHNGFSMYDWSNWIEMSDRLALYAQVSLYAQYIYTQYGNSTFRQILQKLAQGQEFQYAFQNVTGQSASDFTKNFRIAMTANDPNYEDGLYGFRMQAGYDPSEYHDVENLYNWLSPVVFTGNSCSIKGGGAITIKPVDGVYYPPAGASSSLQYYGITLNSIPPEPIALTNIGLDPESITLYEGAETVIRAVREPLNANNCEMTWEIADTNIAAVSGNNRTARITGLSNGTTTLTVRAHDLLNDRYYTAAANITVIPVPDLNQALNIEGGTLEFSSNAPYRWETAVADGRAVGKSTNGGVDSSSSTLSLTVNMNAGDTMSFDWYVSSENNYDKLTFKVNGTAQAEISGVTAWEERTYTALSSGSYTFTWVYSKDSSVDRNDDCGYVDNVYVPGYSGGGDYAVGDVDMDGHITITDATFAQRHAMGLVTLNETQQQLADFNGDGSINITDAVSIMRTAMNLG